MKTTHSCKKVLSIIAFCLMLTALFATWALADSGYGVTVNGITVTSENKEDILSDGGKVKYDPDANTLTATETIGTSLEIDGNGATNIVVTSANAPAVGTFTVKNVSDVTVSTTASAPAITGDANITCTGNVTINSENMIAVYGTLTVNNAGDVTVSGAAASTIFSSADITCSGKVKISSTNSIAVSGNLTVKGATDVTVKTNADSPAITGNANITCTGNVSISSDKNIAVYGTLTVNNAADVTVSGTNSPAILGNTNITCTGNVKISNTNNIAVYGTLTVKNAADVTVSGANAPTITSSADITCTGNVTISNTNSIAVNGSLTVHNAENVYVSGAKAPTIYGDADITCSGTAKIVNEGVYALMKLTFNQADGRAFSVKAGETVDSLSTAADVEAGNAYGPVEHSEKAIYVEPAVSTVTFDANGGTASAESAVTEINGKLASLPDATREGFKFIGWFTEKDGGEEITLSKVFITDTTVYARWEKLPHVHNLTLVPAKDATATEPGNKAYYTCDGCELWFADEKGETEITDKNSVIIPALGEPTEPEQPEEECGCPFFRWLKAFVESCCKWLKEAPVSIVHWFEAVFGNIKSILD